jgi:hypothetical protein
MKFIGAKKPFSREKWEITKRLGNLEKYTKSSYKVRKSPEALRCRQPISAADQLVIDKFAPFGRSFSGFARTAK